MNFVRPGSFFTVVLAVLAVGTQVGCQSALIGQGDIVQTAVQAGDFNTLATALKTAGMVDTLKGEGPFTVFAPTDDAFNQLPEGALDGLLKDPPQLRNVLNYHVVPGKVLAKDVTKLSSAKTALGKTVAIESCDGVKVAGANVIKTDVMASNGVIHVIDKVLIPPE
jgi:uncharacterized surface protein with fasciclin (FAS1) repeats